MCQAVSIPTKSSMTKGPRGVFITVVQARSTSSTVATPFVARVIASRFSALYIALNTYPGLSFVQPDRHLTDARREPEQDLDGLVRCRRMRHHVDQVGRPHRLVEVEGDQPVRAAAGLGVHRRQQRRGVGRE